MKQGLLAVCLCVLSLAVSAAPISVELFSPQGQVKKVRQVAVRFSGQMVSFGDPRELDPFDINCAEKGKGRWADGRNWVYDFEQDLPAGVSCSFKLKSSLQGVAGVAVTASQSYAFNTGGPAILERLPGEWEPVDENQIFILGLDAPAKPESILKNVWCSVDGINEPVPVKLITGELRRKVLDVRKDFMAQYYSGIAKFGGHILQVVFGISQAGSDQEKFLKLRDNANSPIVVLQCQRPFPNDASVKLIWGAGVASLSGIPTTQPQQLAYQVRPAFSAEFHCERANKDAQCIPVLPLTLNFSAPIKIEDAKKIRMTQGNFIQGKKVFQPVIPKQNEGEDSEFIQNLSFNPPFPSNAEFSIELPANLRDDAGRVLNNATSFPLQVHTDDDPPLVKFASGFGIFERNAQPALAVTVRNVEAELAASMNTIKVGEAPSVSGSLLSLNRPQDIISWLRALNEVQSGEAGKKSIFSIEDKPKQFKLPKPGGQKAFEVIGIPLNGPGFYVAELGSPKLGAALIPDDESESDKEKEAKEAAEKNKNTGLFGKLMATVQEKILGKEKKQKIYYVQSAALVTNLAVHFKQGRESSLVWVTSLDKGAPVTGAEVHVRDCSGKVYWHGKTDAQGIARIADELPERNTLPGCISRWDPQYFVTAKLNDDFSFVLSGWSEGISSWRFNLPRGERQGSGIRHAVLDRTLFRAGETVHMKVYARRHTSDGIQLPRQKDTEGQYVIQHQGGDQEYEVALAWDASGIAVADFDIPKEAKQGIYLLQYRKGKNKYADETIGSFRVEAYRVPTMRATLQGPGKPQVNAKAVEMDLQINYLSGGAAAMLPVKLRSQIQPRSVQFADYEGYAFANGGVKVGKEEARNRQTTYMAEDEDGESAPLASDGTDPAQLKTLKVLEFNLDAAGATRAKIEGIPRSDMPQALLAEAEYRDANGETLTASGRVALWPSALVLGIKPDGWVSSKEHLKFKMLALDLSGKPMAGVDLKVDVLQREYHSHRRRLIGGFYAYEHGSEVKLLKTAACTGKSDDKGFVFCDIKPPATGNLILNAQAADAEGNLSRANSEMWVAGSDDWWYAASDNDRMDVLPERKRYEPGETARFQVRTPFADASALVTVEREGVIESFVMPLSRKNPVVEVPIKGNYAPNVFVSVLAVRGRVAAPAPTAMIDLAKPSYRMGIAEINVGWAAHELKVKVASDKPVYHVRDKATIAVEVRRPDGSKPPAGSEIALAAVDEGLLELMGNNSWKLLDAMMKRRGIEVETATAQMQVVGKRHFGRKAVAAGGGGGSGGRKSARELFDTLLFWKARIKLDDEGRAIVQVPLNDSLTSFRIVAVANGGAALFGTGEASITSTQDLMLISGLPPLVREQDKFRANFTVRNTSDQTIALTVTPNVTAGGSSTPLLQDMLTPQTLSLNPGEAREIGWDVAAPLDVSVLLWNVTAQGSGDAAAASDTMKITQKVQQAVGVRTFQATIEQIDKQMKMNVSIPKDAIPGRGGIRVQLQSSLADELGGVQEYMSLYPYSCLEQNASRAVALRDENHWQIIMDNLSSYLDHDGLVKYFPQMEQGSDALTAYILSIADEADYEIPEYSKNRMEKALVGFVEGRVVRYSALPTADLAIRKVAALAALSRGETTIDPRWLDGFSIEPNLWPTSAVIDWYTLLKRADAIPNRETRIAEAEQIMRSRLNFQGTIMTFSTERNDALWWLMSSADQNANRIILELLEKDSWGADMPRLVRGALGRQHHGHWDTTLANAWGVLAMEKFAAKFEATPVSGKTVTTLGNVKREHSWKADEKKSDFTLPWPAQAADLTLQHEGSGKPWAMVQSLAAIPLKEPFSSGYKIKRTVTPIEQKTPGEWNRGDVLRVHLDLEAQSDMSWVVVNDPIPAGSAILGTGLGKDSKILTGGEVRKGWVWPAFEERKLDSFRAYYEFVPKGKWSVEYTLRLNNGGEFKMPETRVEAMYAPEMFAETPNQGVVVNP